MEKIYFTIAGTKHHYGQEFFEPKQEVKLVKEPDNDFDKEALLNFQSLYYSNLN